MAETRVSTRTCPACGAGSGSSRTPTLRGATKVSDRLDPGIDELRQLLGHLAKRVVLRPPGTVDPDVVSECLRHQIDDVASLGGDVAVDVRPEIRLGEATVLAVDDAVRHAGDS